MALEDEEDQTGTQRRFREGNHDQYSHQKTEQAKISRGSQEELQPCGPLDLELIKLILDFGYQILKNNFLLFQATKSMTVCHSSQETNIACHLHVMSYFLSPASPAALWEHLQGLKLPQGQKAAY